MQMKIELQQNSRIQIYLKTMQIENYQTFEMRKEDHN